MKKISLLCLSLILSIVTFAQNAQEGTVRFRKSDHSGVTAVFDASKDQTEDALEYRLKAANLGKKHNESDYWTYKGVNWTEIAAIKIDVYFNIERHKGKTIISMMVSPGNENFISSATDPQIILNMKTFLNNFNNDITNRIQELALAKQKQAVDETNKDLKRADERQQKADEEKKKLQDQADDEKKKLDNMQKS